MPGLSVAMASGGRAPAYISEYKLGGISDLATLTLLSIQSSTLSPASHPENPRTHERTMSDTEQAATQDFQPKAEDANAPINIKVSRPVCRPPRPRGQTS